MNTERIEEAKSIIGKWNKTPDWLKNIIFEVLDKYGQYVYEFTGTSGSVTEVYPIMVWNGYVEFQLNTRDKRHFTQKSLKAIVEKYPQLKRAYFSQTDGSCPDTLVFVYKEPLC